MKEELKISILSDYNDIKQVVEHNKDLEPSESGLKALEEFILSDHEEHEFDLYYVEDYIEKWIEILRNQVENAKINFAGFQAEIVNYIDIMSILWDQDQNGQITFYKVSELSKYDTYNSGYIVAEWLL